MSKRSEQLTAIRRDAAKASEILEDLAQDLAQHDFSDLSFDELRLLRLLTHKALGDQELVDVPALEPGSLNWRPPLHPAKGDDSQEIDLGRLMPDEKDTYLALIGRIVKPHEYGVS